jgi:O-methyltransferase
MNRTIRKLIPKRYRKDDSYHEEIHRREFMRRAFTAFSFNGISGDYAEFGCCGGMTFKLAYQESRKRGFNCKLWAFDSFCGLPPQVVPEDQHPNWIEGTMKTSLEGFTAICRKNLIPESEYCIVAGFYRDTIGTIEPRDPHFPVDISLAYIDCDLYSSTKIVLNFLSGRLKHGMIVALDDYFCYSRTALSGERKALMEYSSTDQRFHFSPYIQFGWHGMSFIVEDKNLLEGIRHC